MSKQEIHIGSENGFHVLESMLSNNDQAFLIFDNALRLTFASSGCETLLELPVREIVGLPLNKVLSRVFSTLGAVPNKLALVWNKPVFRVKIEPVLHNNRIKKLICSKFPLTDGSGRINGLVVNLSEEPQKGEPRSRDVPSINYEYDFLNMMVNLRRFFEGSDRGIVVYDRNLSFYYCNQAFERITKIRRKKLIGFHPKEVSKIVYRDFDYSLCHEELIKSKKSKWNHQGHVVLHDGTSLHLRIDMFPLTSLSGEVYGLVCIVADVTREMLEEERNRLISKFSLVGEMAATLAHEVRNPMTAIKGLAQLLSEGCPADNYPLYELMVEEIDRADSLLANFLNLAQSAITEKEVALGEILHSSLVLIQGELVNSNVILKTDIENNCICIGDPNQLRQACLNLLRNACEAMPEGGILKVAAMAEPGWIRIEISDTGSGIADKIKSQVLEPFFTTKESGTGLGLSVSYKIFQDHGGDMILESNGEKGTRVKIYLPRHS